jgi:hypothetical protein
MSAQTVQAAFDWEFSGIPLHVLFVHFVVIVVPLAALCTVLSVLWPALRRRLGVLTPIVAIAGLAAIPLTENAGEWLERRVQETDLVEIHTLTPWVVGLVLIAVLQWVWFRFFVADGARFSSVVTNGALRRVLSIVVIVVAVAVSVGSVISVVIVGESGSRAAWSGQYDDQGGGESGSDGTGSDGTGSDGTGSDGSGSDED